MIDICDTLIEWAKEIEGFEGRVYRIYPQKNLTMKTYCTITPTGHHTILTGMDGEEVITDLSYSVQVFGKSPKALDSIVGELTDLYQRKNVIRQGIAYGRSEDYSSYTASMSFTVRMDKRGWAFQ